MQTKNQIAQTRVITVILLLLGICFSAFGAGNLPSANAQDASTGTPILTEPFTPEADYVPGEIILKIRSGVTLDSRDMSSNSVSLNALLSSMDASEFTSLYYNTNSETAQMNASEIDPVLSLYYTIKVPLNTDIRSAATKLAQNPNIELAFPNAYLDLDLTSDDPHFINGDQWALNKIKAPDAWNITTGNTNIVVAVLDTGLDLTHPDIGSKNTGTGKDFYKDGYGIQDIVGHGTSVAGIIAANSNNGAGVAGVSWGAQIMPVKVCGFQQDGKVKCPISTAAEGIKYAVDNGANIINMSFGGQVSEAEKILLQDAVNYAYNSKPVGAAIVVSAGNNWDFLSSLDNLYYVPAELDNVIVVGAIDKDDVDCHPDIFGQASNCGWGDAGSGHGPLLDLVAPGSLDIWTTKLGGDYEPKFGGTSAAAPFVSGVVALMRSVDPNITPADIEKKLRETAFHLVPSGDSYPNYTFGWGRVNAQAAVAAVTLPIAPCPQSGGIILYYNANYDCNGQGENSGYVQRSNAGWQNISGSMNENASSVKMPSGWSVMLYENYYRGGGKVCLNSTDSWLSDFNYLSNFPNTNVPIADHASSFEVFTTTGCNTGGTPQPGVTPTLTATPAPGDGIEVCDLTDYRTPCKTYTYINNSTCTNLANDGWDNRIESLHFKGTYIGNYEFILYDDNTCGTYITQYGSDAPNLGDLNNRTGSLRIQKHVPPATATLNPSDGLYLCDSTNWGEPCKPYTYINDSYCVNLVPDGWGERADSLKFIGSYISNYDVSLYDDSACGTYVAQYGSDSWDLGSYKNAVSSIKILKHINQNPTPIPGSINLCDGTNYGQPCQPFTYQSNGSCTNLQPYGWDNRADSMKFVDGYIGRFEVKMFDDNGCSNNSYVAQYGSDAPDLGSFKNVIGSIQIMKLGDPKPDLIPYSRPGKSAPIIISSVSGTTTNSTLYAGEPIFIDWGYKNQGSVNALAHNVKLTIDGQTIFDYPFGSLSAGATNGLDDWSTTWNTPGTFTVTLTVDPYSAVDEGDENNNVWSGQFTWALRQPNQFNKSTPTNGANNQPLSVTLSWSNSSGVDSYQYCYDTLSNSNCDTTWNDIGTSTSVSLPSLSHGTTYYWQVRATNSGGATYADGNTWWPFSTVPAVPNDDFNNAIQIVIPYTNTQTTAGATSAGDDPAFPCVNGAKYNTVWYKYIPSSNGTLSINTFGSSFDTVLGVWTGNRGSLSSQACNDDASGLQSEVQLQAVAGTVYYIEVAGYTSNSNGSLQISLDLIVSCPTITGWQGEYWNNSDLSGQPSLCRNDIDLNFVWGMGTPDPSIPGDQFSAKWTRTINFNDGVYRFHIDHDDGARLYIDDILKLDVWNTCCVWDIVDVQLSAGAHTIRLDYSENGGAANVQLWWEQLSNYTLTVTKNGVGKGTVTSNPAGINCGSDCSENYNYNTSVTLTATPTTGFAFYGWSGACTGSHSCVIAMTNVQSVTATFSKSGDANNDGMVDNLDLGIWQSHYGQETTNGPADGDFDNDGIVRSSDLLIWRDNATFYTLTVNLAGTGNGTVTSNPAGINCPGDCSESYASGTVVTLTANPSAGSTFAGWSGACSGTGTCTVTMSSAQSVTATLTINNTVVVDLSVGVNKKGSYPVGPSSTIFESYASLLDGPVKVISTDGSPIFTTQVVTSGGSYNELAGYPINQFTTEYWFPYYDHGYVNGAGNNMRTWILVGNPSATQTATVQIYIGGVLQSDPDNPSSTTFSIAPGANVTPRWKGKIGGPVQVKSTNGVNIFASERVFTVPYDSFNEVMGYPANQFTTEYWFTWYDTVYMDTYLLVGNTSASQTANVDVYIGTSKMGSYLIAPNTTIKQRYDATVNGPVRVVSTNGVNIVTSEFTQSGTENSFNEVMGYPFNQFATEYWFPYYDHGYVNGGGNMMRTWVLVGNPSATVTANVEIYIGGVLQTNPDTGLPYFSIAPGANVTPRWKGLIGGPVQVKSTNGAQIFASERVFTVPTDAFNEFMGIPASQFTTEYWFTWYDTVYMNTKVMIGKP